jgi:hypothetical protein
MSFSATKLIGHKYAPYFVTPTTKDLSLYALGIGMQQDPMESSHLKYTFEGHPRFQAYPLYPLVMTHRVDLTRFPGLPAFDPLMLVHGEEHITLHQQVTPKHTYEVYEEIVDLQQKGTVGSLLVMKSKVYKAPDQLVASVRTGFFIRGLNGHGHLSAGE